MGWARLDDNRHDHPKVLNLGDDLYALAAVGLLDHAITWASRHRRGSATPGLVPWSFWNQRAGRHAKRLVALLLREKLVDADGADRGVWVHDFDDYGPKRDSAEASEAGKRGAAKRWQKPSGSDSKSHPGAMANDGSRAPAPASPTRPDPTRPDSPGTDSSSRSPSVRRDPWANLPPRLADVASSITAAGIRVAWDLTGDEIAYALEQLDRAGMSALVNYAKARYRADSPPFSARAWLTGWAQLPDARPLELVSDPTPCQHGAPDGRLCALCRTERETA